MKAGRHGGVARGRGAVAATLGIVAAGAAGLWPVLVAAPALADESPQVTRISMKDFTFNPATVTVPAGTAVEWTYDESATDPMPNCESPYFQNPSPVDCGGHSTTASDNRPDGQPLWDSGVHRADGFPFTRVFTTPGTYNYFCRLHGGKHPNQPVTHMNGVIVVVAASSSSGGGGNSQQSSPARNAMPPAAASGVAGAGLPNTATTGSGAGLAGVGVLGLVALRGRHRHHRSGNRNLIS